MCSTMDRITDSIRSAVRRSSQRTVSSHVTAVSLGGEHLGWFHQADPFPALLARRVVSHRVVSYLFLPPDLHRWYRNPTTSIKLGI